MSLMYGKEKDADQDGAPISGGFLVTEGLTILQTARPTQGFSHSLQSYRKSLRKLARYASSSAATTTLRTGRTRSTSRRTSSARTRCSSIGALEERMGCRPCI